MRFLLKHKMRATTPAAAASAPTAIPALAPEDRPVEEEDWDESSELLSAVAVAEAEVPVVVAPDLDTDEVPIGVFSASVALVVVEVVVGEG